MQQKNSRSEKIYKLNYHKGKKEKMKKDRREGDFTKKHFRGINAERKGDT